MRAPTLLKRTLGQNPVSQKYLVGEGTRKDQMGQRELGSGVEVVVFSFPADAWKHLEGNNRIVGRWAACLQCFRNAPLEGRSRRNPYHNLKHIS
ncbi:hypothetical protein CDAR_559651 [Caerostris darwini]|uniref:Uncharacterized protein n=1 Tax=Caerostris darwini TaxID=1538125 RepID=A0AAV4W1P2_9ARAC|nr:hypothetical protein CDAR_559651 [Caerostris darwini]